MSLLGKLVSTVSRQTLRAEGHVFAITPERVGIGEGLRAAFVMAPVLAAAEWLQRPAIGIGVIAAFWCCLCDPQGNRSARGKTLGALALLGSAAVVLASAGASFGYAASLITLFCLIFLCGLTRSYRPALGPAPTQIGVIAQIAAVIGVGSAQSLTGALELGAYFLLGSAWAMLVCLFVWPVAFRQPARFTLAAIFGRLEDFAAYLHRLSASPSLDARAWLDFDTVYRRGIRMSLERGRALAAHDPSGSLGLGAGIDAAGRVFSALIALGHACRVAGQADARALALLAGLRALMQDMSRAMLQEWRMPSAAIAQAEDLLRRAREHDDQAGRAIAFAAQAIARLAQAPQSSAAQAEAPAPAAAGPWRIEAVVWRHALRVAVAAVLAYALGTLIHIQFAYWSAIATIVVTLPISANTWLRILERACGTLLGGLMAALLLLNPLALSWVILPLAALAIALRLVNYGLFVVFLTPMFLLLTDFIHPTQGLLVIRFTNEAVGACVGVAATFLLWPEREGNALAASISGAIAANMKFAAAVLRMRPGSGAQLDRLQVEAGLASTRLETARERMLLEGAWRSARLERLRTLIVALRTICGAAAVVEVLREGEPGEHELRRADAYDAILAQVLAALKSAEEPAPIQLPAMPEDDLDQAVLAFLNVINTTRFNQN